MNNLTDFVFKDTGKVVQIKKVSPMVAVDIDSSIPMPIPPVNKVDYGEPKGIVEEPNYQAQEYKDALSARASKVGRLVTRSTIKLGVVIPDNNWKEEVEEYRKFIQETTGQPLEETDDFYVYITRICVGTQEDMQELFDAITKRSQPSEDAIATAKASFQR